MCYVVITAVIAFEGKHTTYAMVSVIVTRVKRQLKTHFESRLKKDMT